MTIRLRTFLQFVLLACTSALFAAPTLRAALPVIYAFNQSGSTTINLGESVSFNWSVSNGASVSISPDIGPVSGTEITVTPTQTTTYTLTATNASGSVSKSKKIKVIVPPTVDRLTATPATVLPGSAVTLAWTGNGASYYTVTTDAGANLGNVFGTSTKVYPQTSTTYTVTAVNTAGTGARSILVTVVPPGPKPTISSFTASPATMAVGQSTTLNWSVSGADSVTIAPALGVVTGTSAMVSPTTTTTYTLTAKNLNGSVTKKTTVTVTVAPPVIDNFTATPDTIVAGQNSLLAWSVSGASSLSISPEIGAVSGDSIPVSPAADTVYTLTATNAGGTVSRVATVAVKPPVPVIGSFTATPATITLGNSTTLDWAVSGAAQVTLVADVGESPGIVTGTSYTLSPTRNTVYTLTATNVTATVTRSIAVTVKPPAPVISAFTATPATITAGQNTTLAWSVSNATSLAITTDVGVAPGEVGGSTTTVSPIATTTYILKASNESGTVTASTQVTVNDPAPVIRSFVTTPGSIFAGEISHLVWDVSGAATISISADVGASPGVFTGATGTYEIRPAVTTNYTMTATSPGGVVSHSSAQILVKPAVPAPVINTFAATPATITRGSSSTLNWDIASADSVTVSPGVGPVTGTSVPVSPTETTVYTITAVNLGGTTSRDVTVTVTDPQPVGVQITPATTQLSPGATQSFSAVVSNNSNQTVTWSVLESGGGSITSDGLYTAPATAGTYHVKATAAADVAASTQATITVISTGPSIDSFTASADSIEVGEAVTLTWTTTKMGSLWMSADAGGDPGSVAANGTYVAHPQTTTRYTISGWNGETNSTIYKSLTVHVGPPPTPTINSFTASPDTLAIGASTTLNWSVANANTVSVTADVGSSPGIVTGNTTTVTPSTTTTYTITASLGSSSATRSVTVTVTGPAAPVIGAFYSQPAFIQAGETSTLRWSVSGADRVSISPDIGEVTGNSHSVAPSATTTYTLSATNDIGTSTRTTVVTIYVPGTGSVTHPRIWVTPASLPALVARAQANDPAWIRLRNACDTYVTWRVAYPDEPNASATICGGYQYYDYMDTSFTLSLGYLIARTVDPVRAAAYAAQERKLLLALSDTVHHGYPYTDRGWSIRAYVPALAIGYDWIFDTLDDSDRAQIYTEINRWIDDYDSRGFGREYPQGNYFAGFYCAKALGALATEGENPVGPKMWTDWLKDLHYDFVQPYHQQWMSGGSAPDGWGYGKLETLNMLRPLAAAFTAKGLDLLHDTAHPHDYPDGNVKWVTQFTWPDMKTVSDRGLVYDGDNFTSTDADWATQYAGFLRMANGNNAPMAQRYALDLRSQQGTSGSQPWTDMLLFDASAPTANYRTDLSYRTFGAGEVAMRSSWANDAVWASFQSGPFIGYTESAEEQFDQGSLAIQRGGVQFLVNAWGAGLRNTPGTQDGNYPANMPDGLTDKEKEAYQGKVFSTLYEELYGTSLDGFEKARRLFNTYYAARSGGYMGQVGNTPGTTATTLSRFEEGTDYVLTRGANLEGMYMSDHPISLWDRTVVYLRPQLFVVYDRTALDNPNADNWMAWHVLSAPIEQTSAPGTHCIDVIDHRAAFGGNLFRGRITTVLPAGNVVSSVNLFDWGKLYRVEVRPGTASATNTWVTVLDASASAAQAGQASPLTAAHGNLSTTAAEGTVIHNAAGNYAVLFSKSAAPIADSFTLTVPTDDTYVLVADLTPSTGYTVTASVANGSTIITIAPGGAMMSTSQGTLKVDITAAGVVTGL